MVAKKTVIMPPEILALICGLIPLESRAAFGTSSKAFRRIVVGSYLETRVTSYKQLVTLCKILLHHPSMASWISRLILDLDHVGAEPLNPLPAFRKLLADALCKTRRLVSLQITSGFPCRELPHIPSLHEVHLYRRDSIPWTISDLAEFFGKQPKLLHVKFATPTPRSELRALLECLSFVPDQELERRADQVSALSLRVATCDFGVVQEITLALKDLVEVTIIGDFEKDPYKTTFFKDLPAILKRCPKLRNVWFISPSTCIYPHACNPTLLTSQASLIESFTGHPTLHTIVFPSDTRWIYKSKSKEQKEWEPASDCDCVVDWWDAHRAVEQRILLASPTTTPWTRFAQDVVQLTEHKPGPEDIMVADIIVGSDEAESDDDDDDEKGGGLFSDDQSDSSSDASEDEFADPKKLVMRLADPRYLLR